MLLKHYLVLVLWPSSCFDGCGTPNDALNSKLNLILTNIDTEERVEFVVVVESMSYC